MEAHKPYFSFEHNIDIGKIIFLPGVQDKLSFLNECLGCGECQGACPSDCITYIELEPGARVPFIQPLKSPCLMCDDLPCSQVCPNQALASPSWDDIRMGVALLSPEKCLCLDGKHCDRCVQLKPGNCNALSWDNEIRAPLIDINKCSGCGVCAHVCPAEEKAISILPL
jgi:ferredoxin-type protein NapG